MLDKRSSFSIQNGGKRSHGLWDWGDDIYELASVAKGCTSVGDKEVRLDWVDWSGLIDAEFADALSPRE